MAHTDRETQDEAGRGYAVSGTGLRPCCGGLRNTHRHAHTDTHTHNHTHIEKRTLLFNAAYVTLHCKYCKTEDFVSEVTFKLHRFWPSVVSCQVVNVRVCIYWVRVVRLCWLYVSVCIRVLFGFSGFSCLCPAVQWRRTQPPDGGASFQFFSQSRDVSPQYTLAWSWGSDASYPRRPDVFHL